jgi:hypothetical protein
MGVIESAYDIRINTGAPTNGTTEVQTLTIGGTPEGGMFELAFEGQVTAPITWSATDNTLLASINTALRALATIGASGITATAGTLSSGIGTVTLTFGGNLVKLVVPTISVALNSLTGTSPTLAVAETTPGVTATERGAGIGALLINISNGAVYSNAGTSLAPDWTLNGTVASGSVTAAELAADAVETDKIKNVNVTAAKLAADAVETAKIKNVNVTEAKIEVGAAGAGLSGLVAKFAADKNVIGALPVVHRIAVADASGNTDVTLTHKTLILDAWALNTGLAAHATDDHWQLKNGTNAISEEVSKTAVVNAVTRVTTLDPVYTTIAAGGTLRVAAVKDTNAAVTVYVLGLRVA